MIPRDPLIFGTGDQTPSRLDETLPLQPMAEVTPPAAITGPGAAPSETPKTVQYLCPFCGSITPDQPRCDTCGGLLDPLSRQATQNSMGPWFIRDTQQPFRPGCSAETLAGLIRRKRVTLDTVLRGPSTRQFWMPARRVPGVANQLGVCHNCQRKASPGDFYCDECGADFTIDPDRQHLGLGEIRLLPGQGSAQNVAQSTRQSPEGRSRPPESVRTADAFPGAGERPDRALPGGGLDDTRYAIAALNGRVRTMQHGLSAALIATFAILFCGALLIVDARFNLRLGFAELLLDRDPVGVLPVGSENPAAPTVDEPSGRAPVRSNRGAMNEAPDQPEPTPTPIPPPTATTPTDGITGGIPENTPVSPGVPPGSESWVGSRPEVEALRVAVLDPGVSADALEVLIEGVVKAGAEGWRGIEDERVEELVSTARKRVRQLRLGEGF